MSDTLTALKPFIATVASGKPLDFAEARQAFEVIMTGGATPAQIAAFLVALRMRGETVEEIAAAAFDTVVTPWLIDVIAEDLPVLAARINRLLQDGGRWINFGSLAFERPEHARRYSPEETLAIVEEAGFGATTINEATIPYMCSPASRHGRRETVFTFAVTKTAEAGTPPRHKALPDWLVTGKEPVPLLPSFRTQAVSTRIYAYVMSLIDGRRSIEDMATLMERERLMTKEEAIPAIRGFLTRMHDDSRRT